MPGSPTGAHLRRGIARQRPLSHGISANKAPGGGGGPAPLGAHLQRQTVGVWGETPCLDSNGNCPGALPQDRPVSILPFARSGCCCDAPTRIGACGSCRLLSQPLRRVFSARPIPPGSPVTCASNAVHSVDCTGRAKYIAPPQRAVRSRSRPSPSPTTAIQQRGQCFRSHRRSPSNCGVSTPGPSTARTTHPPGMLRRAARRSG